MSTINEYAEEIRALAARMHTTADALMHAGTPNAALRNMADDLQQFAADLEEVK